MKIYVMLLSGLLLSITACRNEDIQSNAQDTVSAIVDGRGAGHRVPDEAVEQNRRIRERWEHERVRDAKPDVRDDWERECRPRGCWSNFASVPTAHAVLSQRMAAQYQIPQKAASLILEVLGDLSDGKIQSLNKMGLSQKILARVANGGHLSRLETLQVSRATGLSAGQVNELLRLLL